MAKRITEISKKSYKDAVAQKKMENDIKKMNDAAMSAYMNDLAAGSDFTSKHFSERAEAAAVKAAASESTSKAFGSSAKPSIGPKVDPIAIILPEDVAEQRAKELKAIQAKKESLWCEAKSDDGHKYYWNVKTGESVWEPPKEGYLTLKEYEEIQKVGELKAEELAHKEFIENVKNSDEIAAALKREQHKKIGAKIKKKELKQQKELTSLKPDPIVPDEKFGWEDPETAARPLGKWQTVEPPK